MKTVKVTKNMLKMHPADLLVKLGAVDKEKKFAFPGCVYFSKEDYKELRKNLKNRALVEFPHASTRGIASVVGMELLNYGPNETLAEALRPGYALVDEEGIEKENT